MPESEPPTIDAVIERMTEIEARFPKADGVARFNDLYLAVTREVAEAFTADGFEDSRFIPRLDVVFAGLYFAAVDAAEAEQALSSAWDPLFDCRAHTRIAPIQFALAGMNAHINYDLCLALARTCRELEIALEPGSPQHRDYLKVNAILARVEEKVKKRLQTELLEVADEALGRLDDVLAMWSVARARDAAWTHAEVLQALPDASALERDYLATLGRIVGLGGRGLLVPVL